MERVEKKNPQITPDLSTANLNKADLYEADLNKANLNKAVLSAADLSGANFSGAQDLTAKQLIFTINWQEAILDFLSEWRLKNLSGRKIDKRKNRLSPPSCFGRSVNISLALSGGLNLVKW